jgi:hypothetical protein
MLRVALVAALLSSAACSTTLYSETDENVRLRFGGGGMLSSKKKTYESIRASGKQVVIDGHMISADAFFAFSQPGACYTENAKFSPHSVSVLGLYPRYDLTERYANMLPPKLRDWFKGHHSYYDWVGFPVVDYEQLKEIWPEGACTTV